MIEITIPGRGSYNFKHLVLDLNGTIALDGQIIEEGLSDEIVTKPKQAYTKRLLDSASALHYLDKTSVIK